MAGPQRRPMTAARSPGSGCRAAGPSPSPPPSRACLRLQSGGARRIAALRRRRATAQRRPQCAAPQVPPRYSTRAQTRQPGAWGCRLCRALTVRNKCCPDRLDHVRWCPGGPDQGAFPQARSLQSNPSGAMSAGSNPAGDTAGGHLPGDTAGGTRHCRGHHCRGTTPDLALWWLTCANRLGVILGVCSQMPRDVALRRVPGICAAWPLVRQRHFVMGRVRRRVCAGSGCGGLGLGGAGASWTSAGCWWHAAAR